MIVAERKPIQEIKKMLIPFQRILVCGCQGCVTVCAAGGAKEVAVTAAALRLAAEVEGNSLLIREATVERQCEFEFVDQLQKEITDIQAVLSLACGAGVQTIAERFPHLPVYPGVNTRFIGLPVQHGVWAERCQACGECLLDRTGGICPVARCAKNLLNGPCGGSQNGKCEIGQDLDCAWQLIYDRLAGLGQLDRLREIMLPKDWSKSRDGGPRRLVRRDLLLEDEQ
ncbi:MAG: hypothetical protein HPY81_02835 [Firmicutes bacterium]|nr:hypothetical protein [Bacillota bacterium]